MATIKILRVRLYEYHNALITTSGDLPGQTRRFVAYLGDGRERAHVYEQIGDSGVPIKNGPLRSFLLVTASAHFNLNVSTVRIQIARARGKTTPAPLPIIASTSSDHRAAAAAEIARCRTIAATRWNVSPSPTVTWKKRGTTAGTAHGSFSIDLNEHFAIKEGAAFMQTVAHEYAHCVVSAMRENHPNGFYFNRARGEWAPHGSKWQSVMRSFGCEPRRCHQYESADDLRRPRVSASCKCKIHQITKTRANRIRHGRTYICKLCRGTLVLV